MVFNIALHVQINLYCTIVCVECFFCYPNDLYLFLYFGARTLITLPLTGQGFPLKEQRHPDGSSIKLPFVAVVIVVGVVAVAGQLYPLQGRDVVGQLYPRQGEGVVG